jgi:hypothetical protein
LGALKGSQMTSALKGKTIFYCIFVQLQVEQLQNEQLQFEQLQF